MKTFDTDEDEFYTLGDMVHFQSFADKATLATHLAHDVAAMLRAGIAERGTASLVVSGGSTPKPFFEALRQAPIEWKHVVITLADERWVDADHEDSNENSCASICCRKGRPSSASKTPPTPRMKARKPQPKLWPKTYRCRLMW